MAAKSKARGPADRFASADEIEERIALALHEMQREGSAAGATVGSPQEYQELWFTLSRTPWRTMALVPGDAGGSAKDIAMALANVGRVLHEAVNVLAPDYGQGYVKAAELLVQGRPGEVHAVRSVDKTIAAVPPVVTDPLGLKVIAAADLVVLCVETGRTRLSALRRTIELVGRERITGCVMSD